MALEVLSGASYHDDVNVSGRNKAEINTAQDSSSVNISVTEIPAGQVGKETGRGKKDGSASDMQIKDAISKANNKLKVQRTFCEFSYDENTKRVSIKVLDEETKEVIKEIPPEDTLAMVEKMWELAGIFIDEKR